MDLSECELSREFRHTLERDSILRTTDVNELQQIAINLLKLN